MQHEGTGRLVERLGEHRRREVGEGRGHVLLDRVQSSLSSARSSIPSGQSSRLRSDGPCETTTCAASRCTPNWRRYCQVTIEPIDQPTSTTSSSESRSISSCTSRAYWATVWPWSHGGDCPWPRKSIVIDAVALGERPDLLAEELRRHADAVQQHQRAAAAAVLVAQHRAVSQRQLGHTRLQEIGAATVACRALVQGPERIPEDPNYRSGDDVDLEFVGHRFGFSADDFAERVAAAAVKLQLVAPGDLDDEESADLMELATAGGFSVTAALGTRPRPPAPLGRGLRAAR